MDGIMQLTFVHFLLQSGIIDVSNESFEKESSFTEAYFLDKGLITQEDIVFFKEQWKNVDTIDISKMKICKQQLPESLAKKHLAVLFEHDDKSLKVATSNPIDFNAIQAIEKELNQADTKFYMAWKLDLHSIVENHSYGNENLSYFSDLAYYESQSGTKISGKGYTYFHSSIAEIFDTIVIDAVEMRATDIHIHSNGKTLEVLFRALTKLDKYCELSNQLKDAFRQHIILKGRGDIAKLTLPQDFKFENTINDAVYGYRVSYLPTSSGYSIVIRVQHADVIKLSLDEIILDEMLIDLIKGQLKAQQGLFLVTGPTGSGKTTLLYSMLRYLAEYYQLKIITLEDPIETTLSFANQVQIDPERGLDFQDIIRVSLRQNPDVLLIGEIRDKITAQMAIRAAMTGIMVFASLHTSEPKFALARLLNFGVESIDLSTSIRMAIGSKIIPILCRHCREKYTPNKQEIDKITNIFKNAGNIFWKKTGCIHCKHNGFSGVVNLCEVIKFNKEIKKSLVLNKLMEAYREIDSSNEGWGSLNKLFKAAKQGDIAFDDLFKAVIMDE